MRINVEQKIISLKDEYNIFIDGTRSYYATTEFLSMAFEVRLYDVRNNVKIRKVTMNNWSGLLKMNYHIHLYNNNNVFLKAMSIWYLHYQCKMGRNVYDLYEHRGRKISIYKNNQQVAWWDQALFSILDGDNYTIHANDDCDYEMLITFCLCIDNYRRAKNNNSSIFAINWGSLFGQVKKFNPDWKPNVGVSKINT